MESVSSPIDLSKIPTSGCRSPCRQQLSAAVSSVENAARAHVLALDELAGQARCAGKPYFISNDEPMRQADIIAKLLHAIGIQAEIRPVSARLARIAGAVCETAWKLLRIASEPPVTRFSADQLCTSHWYDVSAAKRDFAYQAEISIAQGLERLRQSNLNQLDSPQSSNPSR